MYVRISTYNVLSSQTVLNSIIPIPNENEMSQLVQVGNYESDEMSWHQQLVQEGMNDNQSRHQCKKERV